MSIGELIRLARVNAAPVLVVDGGGTVAAANPAAAQALETPCDTLTGQLLSDLATGPPEQVGRALRACSRSGEPVLGKMLLSKADGSTLPFPYKGILLRPPTNATPALLWLQLQEHEQFTTHNGEIRRLQAEIHQRRCAQDALQKQTEALQHEVTARKRVEESLLESQSKLRSVLGTIPDFVLSMDLEGTILFINRSATTQTPEQVVGTSVFDYLPPGHHRILQEALEAVFQTGEVQTIEHVLDGEQNGAKLWLASRIGPIRKETEIVGVTVVSTDISERRQKEKKLRTLHQAVEQSSSTIVITDADGKVEYANPQFEVSTGYTLEEVYGQNPRMLKSGKHSPEFYEELWKTVSSGQEWRGEILNKRKDGTLYWEAACISPVLDAQGHIVQYVGVKDDITDRKQTEEALRESENRLKSILDNASTVVFLKDLEGKYLFSNQRYEDLFHVSSDEMVGKTDFDVFPANVAKVYQANDRRALETGGPVSVEEEVPHDDGTHTYVSVKFPLFGSDGKPNAICGIATDITERKQAEEATQQAREFLEIALAQSPSGILIADAPDVVIRLANQAALDIRGGDQSMLTDIDVTQHAEKWQMYRPDGSLYPPEQLPLSRAVLRGETVRNEELIIRDQEGNDHWINANAAPLHGANGQVAAGIVVLHDISERKQMTSQMQDLAFHDSLTGLPNRTSILRSVQKVIDRRDGKHFALLFLDIDRFKIVNDSLGHNVGDVLLKEIARRLQETLRATDEIMEPARLGGDEFVVLLDNLSSPMNATVVAERLQQSLSQCYNLDGQAIHASASIGVVTSEHCFDSACEMLGAADLAMYESKAAGKARHTVFDQTLREKVRARLQIENEVRDGISRNEFILVYQPIMSLRTGQMAGVEALLRWMHPKRGMLGADEFIPVAEETGLIIPLGNKIINEACRQFAEWQSSPRHTEQPLCMHVNVSRMQLLGPSLISAVEQALADNAVLPECLHLEVTETVIMENPKTAMAVLNELRQLGVRIDIDDFGTGYSSLSCIHEFPIDGLKIDRSFIADVGNTLDSAAILQAVVTLADNLDLPVIAEGIENIEQLALLREIGCEYGQGFLFAKPMSSAEIEQFLCSTLDVMTPELEVTATTAPVSIRPDEFGATQRAP